MHRPVASVVTALWFVIAPGLGGVLVPYLLTGWQGTGMPWPVTALGAFVLVAASVLLVLCFARFVTEGHGTPLPAAPTERVLVGGPYRYVRNPMYLAGFGVVLGQGLLLGRIVLFLYAAGLFLAFLALVHGYEEPLMKAPVRRRVRRLPASRTRLVAAPHAMDAGRRTVTTGGR